MKPSAILVVAHPDDEILFGWRSFQDYDVTSVICVTNSGNFSRHLRMTVVSKLYGFRLTHWNFPDKHPFHFDTTEELCIGMFLMKELDNFEPSDHIITHSTFGEYGHDHHKSIAKIVSEYVKLKNREKTLLQFTLGDNSQNFTWRERLSHFIYFGLFVDSRDAKHIRTSKRVYADIPANSIKSHEQFSYIYNH